MSKQSQPKPEPKPFTITPSNRNDPEIQKANAAYLRHVESRITRGKK